MSEKEKTGVSSALERWRQKRHKKDLPANFQKTKAIRTIPFYKLKFSARIQGKLFRVKNPQKDPYAAFLLGVEIDHVPLNFYKRDLNRLGTYAQKTIPVGENVFATGRVADFIDRKERQEQNAIEVLTTRGIGFLFWRDLELLQPSVHG